MWAAATADDTDDEIKGEQMINKYTRKRESFSYWQLKIAVFFLNKKVGISSVVDVVFSITGDRIVFNL